MTPPFAYQILLAARLVAATKTSGAATGKDIKGKDSTEEEEELNSQEGGGSLSIKSAKNEDKEE